MKSLLWKELRQLAPWGALMLVAMSVITLGSLYSEWYRFELSHVWFQVWIVIVFGSPCSAFVIGGLQTALEVRRDQWAFLIHRGLSPTQIFLAKAGAGLSVYAGIAIVPAFIGLVWCIWHGVDRHLLTWYHALPLLASGLSATAFYFAAVLAVVWKGPWYFSRLLPLAAPVLMSVGVIAYTSEVTEFVPVRIFLAIAIAVIVQGVAAWGVFMKSGEAFGRPGTATVCLAVPVFVAMFGGCLCLFALAGAGYEWLCRGFLLTAEWYTRPVTGFTVTREGHVLQIVSRQGLDSRNPGFQYVSITDMDEPQSNRYAPLIGQSPAAAANLAERFDPLPMATVRYGGYSPFFGRLHPEGTPRHIIEEIGWPGRSNWQGSFSASDGLIYVFGGDGRTIRVPPALGYVVSPDGFTNGSERPQRRFGNMLANSTQPWNQNSQYAWPDLFKVSGNAIRYCLLFDDGLYLIDPLDRTVRLLLAPGEGRKIRCLARLGDAIAVVFNDSISVYSATRVVIGTRTDQTGTKGVDETVDVPGGLQYSFPLPRELARFDEFSFGRLPDRDSIVFAPRSGVSTFDLHRFIEMRLDGTIVQSRDFLQPDMIPATGTIPPLSAVAAFATPGPVVALIAVNEIQQLAAGDAPGTCLRLFRAMPRGMLIPTAVLLGSSLFCGWSAGRTGRRYGFDRRTRRVWQWTAALFGPAALLTLWFLRDWPAFEKCPACASRRPVDRDLCPHCGARAAPPAVNGTEIIIGETALALPRVM